jgi:hypothetical protein
MTARQQALLGYLRTIRPALEGARNHTELLERILKCIAEDAGFVVDGLASVAKRFAMRYVEGRADVALGQFSRFVEDLVSGKR